MYAEFQLSGLKLSHPSWWERIRLAFAIPIYQVEGSNVYTFKQLKGQWFLMDIRPAIPQ